VNPLSTRDTDPSRGGEPAPFTGTRVCAAIGFPLPPGRQGPVFDDDVWDFSAVRQLPAYLAPHERRLDFTRIRDWRWRQVVKEYLFALLAPGHERVRVLAHAHRVPRSLQTCTRRLNELTRWMNWLTDQKIGSLAEVTDAHCHSFALHRRRPPTPQPDDNTVVDLKPKILRESTLVIIDLICYNELFSADRFTTGWRPWHGQSAARAAGHCLPAENKTQPLRSEVLQPLLAASLYFVDVLGPHIAKLRRQVRHHARGNTQRGGHHTIDLQVLTTVLRRHVEEGRPLERLSPGNLKAKRGRGWNPDDPLSTISFTAIATQAGMALARNERWREALRGEIEHTLAIVGSQNPWGRDATHVTRADDTGQVPWTLPIHEKDVRNLAEYATTACIVIIAAVSGMRFSELQELQIGCRRPPQQINPGLLRYRLASRLVKRQPLGGTHDEWVVIEEAYRAAELAAQLHDNPADTDSLFSAAVFSLRYRHFRAWINSPTGQRLGLPPIPTDPVNLRMLRRSLAVELAYRPGGLLATKIHLRHISVVTSEGYASRPGGAQAKMLAEVTGHEQQRNLDLVLAEYRNYLNGIMPSGPAARDLTEFFTCVDGDLAATAAASPATLPTDQHVRTLLAKRASTLHLGPANYCWFSDPAKALCLKLAGTPAADKPLIGMCDSARCPQATHHPCHRPVWATAVENNKTFLGTLSKGQKTEAARLHAEITRSERVLAQIDAAAPAPATED